MNSSHPFWVKPELDEHQKLRKDKIDQKIAKYKQALKDVEAFQTYIKKYADDYFVHFFKYYDSKKIDWASMNFNGSGFQWKESGLIRNELGESVHELKSSGRVYMPLSCVDDVQQISTNVEQAQRARTRDVQMRRETAKNSIINIAHQYPGIMEEIINGRS